MIASYSDKFERNIFSACCTPNKFLTELNIIKMSNFVHMRKGKSDKDVIWLLINVIQSYLKPPVVSRDVKWYALLH